MTVHDIFVSLWLCDSDEQVLSVTCDGHSNSAILHSEKLDDFSAISSGTVH